MPIPRKNTYIKLENNGKKSFKKDPVSNIKVKIENDDDMDILGDINHNVTKNNENDNTIKNVQSQSNESLNKLNFILKNLKLSNELPCYKFTRKPKLKFCPPICTVLNISNLNFNYPLDNQIEIEDLYFLHYILTYSKKIVVITGAGISVNSGIPDFRSSNGLFQGLASKSNGSGKNLFDYNVFRNTDSIGKFEKMIEKLYNLSKISKPSPFHLMIDNLSNQGRLLRLYTQNIDCLDIQLPNLKTEIPLSFNKNSNPKTVQLHGNINLLNCSKCNYINELNDDYFKNRKFGESRLIRTCPSCEEMNSVRKIAGKRIQNNGILRPRIVLYNEFHPDGEIIGTITEKDLKSKPDCLIISGTTLKIPGVRRLVKEMSKVVHSNKGFVIWINIDEPPQNIIDYVDYFDLIIVGDCQLIPGLVKLYDAIYSELLNPKSKSVKKSMNSKTSDSKIKVNTESKVNKGSKKTKITVKKEKMIKKEKI